MKLLRVGDKGKEKPAVTDQNNKIRDLSSHITDLSPDYLNFETILKIKNIDLEKLPERVIIVGGGYIAVEFTGIFHGYGSQVTQLYRSDLFLRGFDHDLRTHLAEEMMKQGIDLRFNSNVDSITKTLDGFRVELQDGSKINADVVMYATGRVPNTGNLGLEEVGVKLKNDGSIDVNDSFQTSVPNIYVLGDVIDRFQLTPVAIAEAMVLSSNLFNGTSLSLDYSNIQIGGEKLLKC